MIDKGILNAIALGDVVALRSHLFSGVNLDARDSCGKTLLHKAVITGNVNVVRALLLFDKSKINATDKLGATALHLASQAGDFEIVATLLYNGAEFRLKDGFEQTPEDCARISGHDSIVAILGQAKQSAVKRYLESKAKQSSSSSVN